MYENLLIELSHFLVLILPVYMVVACSCNDRSREQLHLERRQALRDRQREAVISGRSVRSVIETEVESEPAQCPRVSCVRMTPRLKTHGGVSHAEVYERLSLNDGQIQKIEKEKPPQVVIPVQKTSEKSKKVSSDESSEEYPDERDKHSGGGFRSKPK